MQTNVKLVVNYCCSKCGNYIQNDKVYLDLEDVIKYYIVESTHEYIPTFTIYCSECRNGDCAQKLKSKA